MRSILGISLMLLWTPLTIHLMEEGSTYLAALCVYVLCAIAAVIVYSWIEEARRA